MLMWNSCEPVLEVPAPFYVCATALRKRRRSLLCTRQPFSTAQNAVHADVACLGAEEFLQGEHRRE